MVKNLPSNARDARHVGSIPGLRRFLWKTTWQPTLVFLPEEFHQQRIVVGYSPWGLRESDTTEHAHTHTHTHTHTHGILPSLHCESNCRSLSTRRFPGGSGGKASAYNAGDAGSIPGSGRSPGEGNGNPLQYSCLENPWTKKPGRLQAMGSLRVRHD